MTDDAESNGLYSWMESRRLILSQLKTLDTTIKELSEKIDRQTDSARERAGIVSAEMQKAIAEIHVRIAMLEMSGKIWSAGVGLITGAISAGLMQAIFSHAIH